MNTDKIFAEQLANEYAPKDTSGVIALRKLDDNQRHYGDHRRVAERRLPRQHRTYYFGNSDLYQEMVIPARSRVARRIASHTMK